MAFPFIYSLPAFKTVAFISSNSFRNVIEPGFWYPVSLEFLDYLWTPNIFIYNLKSFNSAKVLNRLAGVWIIDGKDVFYNQFAQVKMSKMVLYISI